jgi:hypothetical protein
MQRPIQAASALPISSVTKLGVSHVTLPFAMRLGLFGSGADDSSIYELTLHGSGVALSGKARKKLRILNGDRRAQNCAPLSNSEWTFILR